MFPKNKIDLFYRLLCLFSYIGVIFLIKSIAPIMILFVIYCVLALTERSFRNIELLVISLIILFICYLFDNYWVFRIMLSIDYIFYFLDTSYYIDEDVEEIKLSEKDYVRFKKVDKKKKGSNNITALYLTVHLGLLFLAIMVS